MEAFLNTPTLRYWLAEHLVGRAHGRHAVEGVDRSAGSRPGPHRRSARPRAGRDAQPIGRSSHRARLSFAGRVQLALFPQVRPDVGNRPRRTSPTGRLPAAGRTSPPHVGGEPMPVSCADSGGRRGGENLDHSEDRDEIRQGGPDGLRHRPSQDPRRRAAGRRGGSGHRLHGHSREIPAARARRPPALRMARNCSDQFGHAVPLLGGHVQRPSHPLRSNLRDGDREISRPRRARTAAGGSVVRRGLPARAQSHARPVRLPRGASAVRLRDRHGERTQSRRRRNRSVLRDRRRCRMHASRHAMGASWARPKTPRALRNGEARVEADGALSFILRNCRRLSPPTDTCVA